MRAVRCSPLLATLALSGLSLCACGRTSTPERASPEGVVKDSAPESSLDASRDSVQPSAPVSAFRIVALAPKLEQDYQRWVRLHASRGGVVVSAGEAVAVADGAGELRRDPSWFRGLPVIADSDSGSGSLTDAADVVSLFGARTPSASMVVERVSGGRMSGREVRVYRGKPGAWAQQKNTANDLFRWLELVGEWSGGAELGVARYALTLRPQGDMGKAEARSKATSLRIAERGSEFEIVGGTADAAVAKTAPVVPPKTTIVAARSTSAGVLVAIGQGADNKEMLLEWAAGQARPVLKALPSDAGASAAFVSLLVANERVWVGTVHDWYERGSDGAWTKVAMPVIPGTPAAPGVRGGPKSDCEQWALEAAPSGALWAWCDAPGPQRAAGKVWARGASANVWSEVPLPTLPKNPHARAMLRRQNPLSGWAFTPAPREKLATPVKAVWRVLARSENDVWIVSESDGNSIAVLRNAPAPAPASEPIELPLPSEAADERNAVSNPSGECAAGDYMVVHTRAFAKEDDALVQSLNSEIEKLQMPSVAMHSIALFESEREGGREIGIWLGRLNSPAGVQSEVRQAIAKIITSIAKAPPKTLCRQPRPLRLVRGWSAAKDWKTE